MDSSERSTVETVRPERRTVTRSEISATSSMRCEMNRMAVPSAASRRISTKSRSRVLTSREAVDSSRMSTLGLRTSARAMHRDCRSESESCPAGRSSGYPAGDARQDVVRRWSLLGAGQCATESSVGAEPDILQDRLAPCGEDFLEHRGDPQVHGRSGRSAGDGDAVNVTVPESGRWTPPMIFTSVLFPEPFSPRSVWISPGRRCRSPSMRARVAPKRLLTPASTSPEWLVVHGRSPCMA